MNKDNELTDNNLEFFIQDTEDDTVSISNLSTDGFFCGDDHNNICNDNGNPITSNFEDDYNELFSLPYYRKKAMYGEHDALYYESEYTVKDLMKICEYYKIDKQVKGEKNKKLGIISAIVFFESLAENQHIVIKRHKMWAYIDALSKDENMRKYIIWN